MTVETSTPGTTEQQTGNQQLTNNHSLYGPNFLQERVLIVVEGLYHCFRCLAYDPLAALGHFTWTLIKTPAYVSIQILNLFYALVGGQVVEQISLSDSLEETCRHIALIFQNAISAATFFTVGLFYSPESARYIKHYTFGLSDYRIAISNTLLEDLREGMLQNSALSEISAMAIDFIHDTSKKGDGDQTTLKQLSLAEHYLDYCAGVLLQNEQRLALLVKDTHAESPVRLTIIKAIEASQFLGEEAAVEAEGASLMQSLLIAHLNTQPPPSPHTPSPKKTQGPSSPSLTQSTSPFDDTSTQTHPQSPHPSSILIFNNSYSSYSSSPFPPFPSLSPTSPQSAPTANEIGPSHPIQTVNHQASAHEKLVAKFEKEFTSLSQNRQRHISEYIEEGYYLKANQRASCRSAAEVAQILAIHLRPEEANPDNLNTSMNIDQWAAPFLSEQFSIQSLFPPVFKHIEYWNFNLCYNDFLATTPELASVELPDLALDLYNTFHQVKVIVFYRHVIDIIFREISNENLTLSQDQIKQRAQKKLNDCLAPDISNQAAFSQEERLQIIEERIRVEFVQKFHINGFIDSKVESLLQQLIFNEFHNEREIGPKRLRELIAREVKHRLAKPIAAPSLLISLPTSAELDSIKVTSYSSRLAKFEREYLALDEKSQRQLCEYVEGGYYLTTKKTAFIQSADEFAKILASNITEKTIALNIISDRDAPDPFLSENFFLQALFPKAFPHQEYQDFTLCLQDFLATTPSLEEIELPPIAKGLYSLFHKVKIRIFYKHLIDMILRSMAIAKLNDEHHVQKQVEDQLNGLLVENVALRAALTDQEKQEIVAERIAAESNLHFHIANAIEDQKKISEHILSEVQEIYNAMGDRLDVGPERLMGMISSEVQRLFSPAVTIPIPVAIANGNGHVKAKTPARARVERVNDLTSPSPFRPTVSLRTPLKKKPSLTGTNPILNDSLNT